MQQKGVTHKLKIDLETLRIDHRMTRTALSEFTGLAYHALSNAETRAVMINPGIIGTICAALGLTPTELAAYITIEKIQGSDSND